MADFEPKQFGKYYLIEKLAVGGMAEIYKAKTYGVDGFEKLLVLKRILPHCSADRDFITMLVDEAKLSVTLSHANVVQVYDLGKVGDDYFISMEYINGVNLRDIIYRCRDKGIQISDELATYIISEVCKGLDYAHRKTDNSGTPLGIVHRDVSPQNILISFDGEVKIVDFGIAKAAMNISHTMAGILKGKIAYMSPEQALGKSVDYKADLFSTGIVLYETLTLEKLFTGESQFEVLKKIRSTKIDITKLPESIPDGLKPILAKGLAYHTRDRYQSAGDMQIDLTRYLYTSHIDFSPQKLAAFIKDLFAEEIAKQRERGVMEKVFEAQTSSINIAEEALQENIVHRADTSPTLEHAHEPSLDSISKIEHTDKTVAAKGLSQRLIAIAAMLVIMAGIGFAYFNFIRPNMGEGGRTAAGTIETGTMNIDSVPDGASVFLDGKDTELTTPAIIDGLELNKTYSVKLIKNGFADTERTITVSSTEPLKVKMDLEEALGVLEVVSEPEGANISLNEAPSGMVTPFTLKGLELNTDIKIGLYKQGFSAFEQTINLNSYKPQRLTAKLAAATQAGSINITSVPEGAQIILNGRDTGLFTPSTISELPIGEKQSIRIIKNGFETDSRTITLSSSEPVELKSELKSVSKEEAPAVTKAAEEKRPAAEPKKEEKKAEPKPVEKVVKEEKKAEPKAKPEPKPEPAPKPAVKEEKAPTYASSAQPAGIRINSNPGGAEVFINGEYKGTTPATISDIRPGTVSVLVNKEGKSRFSQKISLSPGETKDLGTVKLGDIFAAVSISSSPSGAKVYFDGADIGARTPLTIKKVRRDQKHSLKLELNGYQTWESSFEIGDADEKKFNVTLEK